MGTELIPTRANGQTIDDRWFNIIRSALIADFCPRDNTGAAVDGAGALGAAAYRFIRAVISRGHFKCGDIKKHHSFNGAVPVGQGWMLCDGRLINQTNYDAEHAGGDWAAYVIASPIDGLYLPDLTGKFAVGAAATTQDGSAPITSVGNAGSTQTFDHNHKWLTNAGGGADTTWDISGNPIGLSAGSGKNLPVRAINIQGSKTRSAIDLYTASSRDLSGNPLGSKDITPGNINVQYYMRVI